MNNPLTTRTKAVIADQMNEVTSLEIKRERKRPSSGVGECAWMREQEPKELREQKLERCKVLACSQSLKGFHTARFKT